MADMLSNRAAYRPFVRLLALATVLPAGCVSGPLRPYSPKDVPAGSPILSVPLVRQKGEHGCGFAALEMLAKYYRVALDEDDRQRAERDARSERGISGATFKAILERNGFRAYIFEGELLDTATPRGVAYHLRRGRPAVVMVSPKGTEDHYMVISGLSESSGLVFFEDPGRGKVACSLAAFGKMWERSGRFTLLAVPVHIGGERPR